MAIALQAPELNLSQEETEQYAKALSSVARHYDLGASAKALDWTNLIATMGSIYGVRAMGIIARRKAPRRSAPVPNGHDAAPVADADVIDFSRMTGRPN